MDHFPAQDCSSCHTPDGWATGVDHRFFPLEFAHAIACEQCHTAIPDFTGLDRACASCHQERRPPAHFEPFDCAPCHAPPRAWSDAIVDHSFFPTTGSHAVPCESCHTALPSFLGLSSSCASCHEADRPSADHFPGQSCEACHETSSWQSGVDHSFFPLQNSHTLPCTSCHLAFPDTAGLSTACGSCHEVERPPDHFPSFDCAACHDDLAWSNARVDHSFLPLQGNHAIPCESCHTTLPSFLGLSGACSACHEPDRPAADHFPGRDCGACHTPDGWPTGIDHSFFPLSFSHALPCDTCHTNIPDFSGLDGNCGTCHAGDRPDAQHYPSFDCGGCHEITQWSAGHDHTFFPLQNAHQLTCDTCHPNIPDFTGNDPLCASCHGADRPTPDHFAGMDCGLCHVPSVWADVQAVDHSFFPLQNSHALECDNCHLAFPDTSGLSQVCESCHEIHRPGCHFVGESCADCHDPSSSWRGSAVPINHAARYQMPVPHRNADQCAECHTTPNSQCDFNCLGCHQDAPNDHSEVPGFSFTSEACIACHPDGRND